MTTTDAPAPTDTLAPVREALLRRAHDYAARLLAEAAAAAAEQEASARREAEAIRAMARAQGEADAAAVLADERARARRRARAVVLEAQGAAYERLRSEVRMAVADLRHDPAYPALLAQLTVRVKADLGPEIVISEHPDGGVIGEAGGRRMTYLLTDLADAAVADLSAEPEGWSS